MRFIPWFLVLSVFVCPSVFAERKRQILKSQNICTQAIAKSTLADDDDLFLEEVYGVQALEWVKNKNLQSATVFEARPDYLEMKQAVEQNLNSLDKLVHVSYSDDWVYNFWQDAKNPQGLWRRMSLFDYQKGLRQWDVLLDVDALGKAEGQTWVFHGARIFKERAIVSLSDGGKDASITREFDLNSKSFVANGFALPEGKNSVQFLDEDTAVLGLAMNEDQRTDSGYPRQIRLWKRGTDYKSAPIIYEGSKASVSVSTALVRDMEFGPITYRLIVEGTDFFNRKVFVWREGGSLVELRLPSDADLNVDNGYLYVKPKREWNLNGHTYSGGTLLRFKMEEFLSRAEASQVEVLFVPTASTFSQGEVYHKGRIFLLLSEHVNSKVVELIPRGRSWSQKKLPLPENSEIGISSYSEKHDLLNFSSEGFLSPTTIHSLNLQTEELTVVDQAPKRFAAENYVVKQFFAKSKDGTKVPYYVVHHRDVKYNGKNPTLITAYGGFELSSTPFYSFATEHNWLRDGGVFVLANIRGGGEYGPAWHLAGLKNNRQRVYEDFFAVSEDLIHRKISSPSFMGAKGGSNGGLLMGVAMTQRPDLYQAIAIEVPLLDMLRYHKLLAGASWVGEYGSPDEPQMREYLRGYSPYHNLSPEKEYPEVFFMTSTADDRVHPGHARRMAARMERMGLPFYYYENTEGGHGGAANNGQRAKWSALEFAYFRMKLNLTRDPNDR